ncbi:MAG: hypothetical protein VKP62_14575 [Candidatus Sericytochromatia bacterium]|nr:hypothetical protein [Candidatus Sericytochromatia bacterium]
MPLIARRQILTNLQASLAALPGQPPEAVLKAAIAAAGLKDKASYSPEETAQIARAVMARAVNAGERALTGWQAEVKPEEG